MFLSLRRKSRRPLQKVQNNEILKYMSPLDELLEQILRIPSNTFQEQKICAFVQDWLLQNVPGVSFQEYQDSFIATLQTHKNKPHLSWLGHLDVVPPFFPPSRVSDRFYGAGASDMKSALACALLGFQHYAKLSDSPFQLSLVFYAREEGTSLEQNGLYALIQKFPEYFRSVNLAIVGEPTNNAIHVGCVGSIHVRVTISGVACHSARPWEGKNALYEAIPFISKIAQISPIRHRLFGVDFFEVVQITENQSESGRTKLPGWWKGNINFRFAPHRTLDQAREELYRILTTAGVSESQIEWLDGVCAGGVLETELFCSVTKALGQAIEAKQAWTDIAQLTLLGIPAFNYGPGWTSQCHKNEEYCSIAEAEKYLKSFKLLFEHSLVSPIS